MIGFLGELLKQSEGIQLTLTVSDLPTIYVVEEDSSQANLLARPTSSMRCWGFCLAVIRSVELSRERYYSRAADEVALDWNIILHCLIPKLVRTRRLDQYRGI